MKKSIFLLSFILLTIAAQAQKGMKTLFAEHIFTGTEGTKKSLAEIIKAHEGKVIYIDFWASWCMPCRSEMQHSIDLHERMKGQDIVFIYLSIDSNDKESAWKSSMEKLKISNIGEHWRRDSEEVKELMKFLYIYSIPHYLIVGKDGQVANRDALPPSDPRVERQLKKLLKH